MQTKLFQIKPFIQKFAILLLFIIFIIKIYYFLKIAFFSELQIV